MKETKDRDGKTLLDNSMIVWGSGLGDPNRHQHDQLPIVVAGRGGGRLKAGRHVVQQGKVPLNNLHLRLLQEMGGKQGEFGDATGPLADV